MLRDVKVRENDPQLSPPHPPPAPPLSPSNSLPIKLHGSTNVGMRSALIVLSMLYCACT